MDIAEEPKLFINEYYNDKINQIDLKCEKEILKRKDEAEIRYLNELRFKLIEKIKSAKQTVKQRYNTLKTKYTKDMLKNNTKNIMDEIFIDQYCVLFNYFGVFNNDYISELHLF